MNCRQDEVNATTMRCPTAVASPWTVCFRVFAGYRKWHGALALLTGLGALLLGSPHAQAQGLQKLWEIPADGSRDYVNGFPSERGLVFIPTTGHLLLSSRALGPTVAVLASTNGAELGFLDVTGVSGGSVAIGPLGAGEDGRIYGVNISGSDILAPSLRVYRWNNETSAPVVLFSGNPAAGLNARWGDSLAVRGAGTNTQLLVGGGGSSVLLLRYANGAQTSLLAQRIEWPQAGAGSFSQGIAFGIGNQLLAKSSADAQVLRVSFPTSSAPSITATSLSPITLAEGIGPIAFNASSSRLIGLNVESHRLLIFDVSSPSSALLLGQMSMPEPSSPNAAGIGQTAFGGGRFYALESQNGLIAVALASETSAPEFVEQPADLDVLEGAPVLFAASALGQQPIRFQWTVGESPIPGETNRVLRFDSASGTNAGVYQVVASNSLGTVTSREAQLTVLESVRSKVASRAWAVAPGAASHVPASPVAMAMTVNRQSGNLVLLHREGNNTVFVVDPANGDAVRVLSLASELLSPGAFRLGSIASADDGAIYASTISQDGVATPVRIYRWPNDDGNATPGVVFAGDPGLGAASSWGSGMAVRGSGPTLEILLTSDQGNSFSILTPNGATLNARRFQVDVPPGSLGSVPAFGQGASFWVKPQNSALLSIGFNLTSGLASVLRTAGPDDYPAEAAPIAFLDGFSLLASVHPGVSTPVLFHRISNEDLALVDTEFFPGIAPPGSRLASIAAHGKTVFAWMPGAGLVGISVAGSGDPPMLNVSVEGDGFRLTWAGDFVLQTALDPAGPWTDVSGASSGHRVVFESGQNRFFRLRE